MKVLNVSMAMEPVAGGGTGERTYQMSRFLARAGVECSVLTLDLGLTPRIIDELRPANVTALYCVSPRFGLFPLPDRRIAELVQWSDVIHLVGHWTLLNAVVCREARKLGKPYVICPAGALRIYGRSRLLKLAYNAMVGKRMVHEASAWIAISRNEFAHFADFGVPADRVTLIPNGIDADAFRSSDPSGFRSKFGVPSSPFVFYLGRLNPIKGPDLLLRAYSGIANAFPELQLVVAGQDEGLLRPLREMARRAGIAERVHFIGPVRGADKSHAYHAASLLVVPSRQEAMSIVALEAGICGTPVLITDRCGFDEVAESGGGLVSPATEEGLQAGLQNMLASMEKLQEMGAKLRAYIDARYLWNTVVRQYLDLFDRVVSRRKAACGS
jgi:glycosyltransferase involved in cell wall biosynthesis